MSLSAVVKASIVADLTTSPDLASLAAHIEAILSQTFTDGAGAAAVNVVFADRRTLSASASEDLDLSGALTQPNGSAAVFARVKAIIVKASSGNTNNVNWSRHASTGVPIFLAASDGIPVRPGGVALWMAPDATGIAVTATTADTLTFTNSAGGTDVTYDIIVLGAAT